MVDEKSAREQLLEAIDNGDIEAVKKLVGFCDLKNMSVVKRGYYICPNKDGGICLSVGAARTYGASVRYCQIEVPIAFYALGCSTREIADLLVKNGAATEGIFPEEGIQGEYRVDFDYNEASYDVDHYYGAVYFGDGNYKLNYEQLVEFLELKREYNELDWKLFPGKGVKIAIEEGEPMTRFSTPKKPSILESMRYNGLKKKYDRATKKYRVERKFYRDAECTDEIKRPAEAIMER